jgi:hypothetical protein
MSTSRPFAYNTGAPIPGTEQVGDLAIGLPTNGFGSTGLAWWNGPDEDLGYVIAKVNSGGNQPTPVPEDALILSPTYKGAGISLSNNNQTATQAFSYSQSVLSDVSIDTYNKVMFSVIYTSTNPSIGVGTRTIGLGNTSMNYSGPFNGYPGNDGNSVGFSDDGNYYYNGTAVLTGLPTWTSGDIIDIAIDNDNAYCWIRVNGGSWNGQSSSPAGIGASLYSVGFIRACLNPSTYGTMKILNYPVYGSPAGYDFLGNVTASVAFSRSTELTQSSFILLANSIGNQVFASGAAAKTWLNNNGYWTSWEDVLPIFSLDAGDVNSYPGSGTTWTDTVGGLTFSLENGQSIGNNSGPIYDSNNGGSIYFATMNGIGGSDYAECLTSLPSLPTFTVSVWIRWMGTVNSLPAIITEIQSGSGPINYKIGKIVPSSADIAAGYRSNGSWRNTTTLPNSIDYNQVWFNVLMTVDSQQNLKLYLNNNLIQSVTFTGEIPSSSGQGIRLMKNHGNLEENTDGYLAKVDIYDKALNSVEISDIWDLNRNRFGL